MITDKEIKSLGWIPLVSHGEIVKMYVIGSFVLVATKQHVVITQNDKGNPYTVYRSDDADCFKIKIVMRHLKIPINGSLDPIVTATDTPRQGEPLAETPIKPTDEVRPKHVFDRFRGTYIKDLGHMVLECKISLYSLVDPKLSLEISSYRVGEKGIVIDNNGCPKETYSNISFVIGVDQAVEAYFLAFQKTHLL